MKLGRSAASILPRWKIMAFNLLLFPDEDFVWSNASSHALEEGKSRMHSASSRVLAHLAQFLTAIEVTCV